MARIGLQDVTKDLKIYGGNARAVDSLTLDIADRELMVFVGPSGCGKATALRMVAGWVIRSTRSSRCTPHRCTMT